MATELLVDERIEDGGRLAVELVRGGFDLTAAFWIHTEEDGLWFLYIASSSVGRNGLGNAYRTVIVQVSQLHLPAIELTQIKVVDPATPIAAEAIALRDRHAARIPTRLGQGRLGGIAIEEAYVYPPMDRSLTRREVIQAVTAMLERPASLSSSVTLRSGTTLHALPVGLQASPSGGVTVTLRDPTTGQTRDVPADEIAGFQ